jgi:ACS family sodium-dependent inorganic phosphate cotransporter
MLCNMDRVNMSIAILPMSQQFGWDSATIGLVQSSFFWGYLLTQVLGGVWADKYGGKKVLGFGVIWWSIATALTPLAAKMGLPVLLTARACMGIGEGVAMPAMNNLLSRWVPVGERSRSLALVYSGMYTGSIFGLALSPHMIQWLQWPSVFYIFGFMGIFWYLAWDKRAASNPETDALCGEEEKQFIMQNTVTGGPAQNIPWKLLLSKGPVWALILSHFCHNWGTFILLTWMPTYYNQVLGLDLLKSGFFSVLPWVTMAISANVGGWIADTLIGRGWSITTVRKIMQTIGFLGPAFFLTQLSHVSGVGGAVGCMMACQGLDAFSQSGLYSNHQDIAPRYAGVLLGMSNTAGVLAGVLGTAATGMILKTGTWDDVWHVAIVLYLVGTAIWNLMATGERVID